MIRPTRVRRLRRRRALKAGIVAVGVTASVLIVSSAWAKDVTLVIDGHSQEVHTRSTSVEDLLTDQGVPLSVGRKRRTVSGSLKRALYRRDQKCTFPGCDHRIFLEGHHIKHWADGGETSLLNTALLCSLHHRFVHEYGYSIELGADQRPRFRDPQGRLVKPVPERPAPSDLGWPKIRGQNEPLAITADAITCWDGTPVDYGTIVGHLLAVDGLAA